MTGGSQAGWLADYEMSRYPGSVLEDARADRASHRVDSDLQDNCPRVPNRGQRDSDGNGRGDACESER